MTKPSLYPGWRTMTGAQRRNARMSKIFADAYELAARKAGWQPDQSLTKFHRVIDGDLVGTCHVTPWKELCAKHDLLGLRS